MVRLNVMVLHAVVVVVCVCVRFLICVACSLEECLSV